MSSPRVAAQQPPSGKIEPTQHTMLLNCLDSILRAGRCVAARGRRQRRDESLIETDGEDEKSLEHIR